MAPFLGVMSPSPSGKTIRALPSWWRWNFILTERAALWILYCFFYCPPPMIPPASESMYQSQSFYPPVLLMKILNLTEGGKEKKKIYIYITQLPKTKNSLVCQYSFIWKLLDF